MRHSKRRERWLFSYVIDHDLGVNPNPVGGLCTLAHCKFSQSGRRNLVEMAEEGDWVVGTGGQNYESAGNGKLIYAMRVTKKISLIRYLNSPRYAGRADRFAETPNVHGRFVLISDEYYYFGCKAIDVTLIPRQHLTHPFEKGGMGYRRDFNEAFIGDFEEWLRSEFARGIHGEPCAGRPPHWNSKRRGVCRVRRVC
jgi:hypothetical protein